MSRYRITIAYDGRELEGWQSQPGGNTVQDRLESGFASLGFPGVKIHGSGRTDAGVHALGQVAHFDAPEASRMDGGNWVKALNTKLPDTIRVLACQPVEDDFHARFQAEGKSYRYRLHLAETGSPFEAGRAWRVGGTFDRAAFARAASLFAGEHDFVAFAANRGNPGDEPESTVRKIFSVEVKEEGEDILTITFSGSGFLYRMVRLMVGSLVRVAQGRESLEWLRAMVESGTKEEKCRFCAPGEGLYLVEVSY